MQGDKMYCKNKKGKVYVVRIYTLTILNTISVCFNPVPLSPPLSFLSLIASPRITVAAPYVTPTNPFPFLFSASPQKRSGEGKERLSERKRRCEREKKGRDRVYSLDF